MFSPPGSPSGFAAVGRVEHRETRHSTAHRKDGAFRVPLNATYIWGRLAAQVISIYPGDLGHITPSGILVLTGREAGVMNVAGEKVTAERIEAVVGAFPGVSDAAVRLANSGGRDELTCAVAWRGPENLEGLQAHLRNSLPPHFVPQKYETVQSIPRNASGKIERKETTSAQLPN